MTSRRARAAGSEVNRYTSLALPFTLACDDATFAARFADLYRACADATQTPTMLELTVECDARGYSLSIDGEGVCERVGLDDALEWCAWTINRAAVDHSSESSFLVHAAAAAGPPGAVVFVGPSGSGKSTLAAALGLAGLAYMGDDGVVLDLDDGAVRSNPKPVAVDEPSRAALAGFAPACTELREGHGLLSPTAIASTTPVNDAVPIALVVRPAYRPGAGAVVAAMSPATAATLLVDESFNFEAHAPNALHAVAALARRVPALDLEFDDLASAVEAIVTALRDSTFAKPLPDDARRGYLPPELSVELLDGEAVVWNPARRELHHLNRVTTAVWFAALDGGSGSGPAANVDDRQTVEHCLDELAATGLLGAAAPAEP
jgi:hypothetical protein